MNNNLKEKLITDYTELLLNHFGGLDWWKLSKRWKCISAEQIARLIVNDIEYFLKEKDDAEVHFN